MVQLVRWTRKCLLTLPLERTALLTYGRDRLKGEIHPVLDVPPRPVRLQYLLDCPDDLEKLLIWRKVALGQHLFSQRRQSLPPLFIHLLRLIMFDRGKDKSPDATPRNSEKNSNECSFSKRLHGTLSGRPFYLSKIKVKCEWNGVTSIEVLTPSSLFRCLTQY